MKAHVARLKKLAGPEMERAVGKALFHAGEMIQTDAQISITAGAVSGRNHVPSRPGEPPNNDTGVLAGNIETNQIAPLIVEVSSNAPYAADLELGTSKMEARPYMRPARDRNKKAAQQLVAQAVDRVVRKSRSQGKG